MRRRKDATEKRRCEAASGGAGADQVLHGCRCGSAEHGVPAQLGRNSMCAATSTKCQACSDTAAVRNQTRHINPVPRLQWYRCWGKHRGSPRGCASSCITTASTHGRPCATSSRGSIASLSIPAPTIFPTPLAVSFAPLSALRRSCQIPIRITTLTTSTTSRGQTSDCT